MALVSKNAAEIVKDANAEQDLIPTALNLMVNKTKLAELEKNILSLGRPNATDAIIKEIEKLIVD